MTRSTLFNFGLGILFGVMAGAAGAVHVCTNHARQHAEEFSRSLDGLNQQIEETQKQTAELQRRAETCETAASQMKAKFDAAGKAAEMDKWERDFADRWYTLVYEPEMQFAPNAQGQALAQILNLYRPGLGTVIANLQAKPQPGMQLRMVLHGYVKAEEIPAGVHLVYTLQHPDAVPAPAQVQ